MQVIDLYIRIFCGLWNTVKSNDPFDRNTSEGIMNRKITGIALVVVAIVAFPAILFAEDISLDTVVTWVEEIAFEQDRQSEVGPKNWTTS